MQNSESLSQDYMDEFEPTDQFEQNVNEKQRAILIQNEEIKQTKQSSGQIAYFGDLKIKLPLKGKQTEQTSSPLTYQNSVNITPSSNRYLLPKKPHQSIGAYNIDRKQFLQKIAMNSRTPNRLAQAQKLPNLGQVTNKNHANGQRGFKRSRISNNRRSLHIVMSDKKIEDKKSPNEYLFVKNKRKSNTSHVNSVRRYAHEQVNINTSNTIVNDIHQLEHDAIIHRTRQKLHLMSTNILRSPKSHSQNKSLNQLATKDEDIYKQPQTNSQRVVVFIKTYILSPFQSISLEISVLNGSIVIVGKLLGHQMDKLRLVLNQQRSQKILDESFHDWEIVGKRVFVETNQSGVKQLKIAPIKSVLSSLIKQQNPIDLNNNPSISLSNKTKHKNLLFIKQTQFLQRNYYSIINKNDQTLNIKQHSVVNSINPSSQNTINHNQNSSDPKIYKKHQRSPSIDINEHLTRQNKHLNYLSPEIRQMAQQYKKEKENSLTKEAIHKQIQERQILAKRQQEQVQRLSKPKQTIKSKSKEKINNKAKINFERSIGKEKKLHFRAVNPKNHDQQKELIKSISLKNAQSQVNIKMSHLQKQAQMSRQYKRNSVQEIKRQTMKTLQDQIKKEEDPAEWKEMNLQKTYSIYQVKIQNSNEQDKYSDFQSQVSKYNEVRPNITKNKQIGGEKDISKASDNYYEEDEFEPQHTQTQTNQVENTYVDTKINQKQLSQKPQKVPEHSLLSVSAKQSAVKQNPSEKFQNSQSEDLIRDIEEDEYDQSFDQFKQQKPNEMRHKMKKVYSKKQITKQSQVYDDEFENQRYVEEITNSIKNEMQDSRQQNEYEQDYEHSISKGVEYIMEQNDMLNDNQIIKEIEENYLDQEFDL